MTLQTKTPLKRGTPLRKKSKKRAKYEASDLGKAGLAHMRRVKQLPCVICHRPGPSEAHHVFHGRYGTRKESDFDVIPLCIECHKYPHPNAIHSGKESWAERNGYDYEYLPVVADMLAGELTPF